LLDALRAFVDRRFQTDNKMMKVTVHSCEDANHPDSIYIDFKNRRKEMLEFERQLDSSGIELTDSIKVQGQFWRNLKAPDRSGRGRGRERERGIDLK